MPHILFTVHADCDSQEPSRIVPVFEAKFSSSKENLTTKSGSVKSTHTSFCEVVR